MAMLPGSARSTKALDDSIGSILTLQITVKGKNEEFLTLLADRQQIGLPSDLSGGGTSGCYIASNAGLPQKSVRHGED